jgi:general nucleoside transport system permease protein
MEAWALLLAGALNAGTPLALAALGLLLNERAGVVNLAAEGLMLVAAVAGYAAAVHTASVWVGFACGAAAGALLSSVLGVLVIWLNTNPYATGLALSMFGAGLSSLLGAPYTQQSLGEPPEYGLPWLADIPFWGTVLFKQHPLVYGTMALAGTIAWFLYRTRAGLVLRAVGESPQAAHELGHAVRHIRLVAVVVGGALCGLGGSYISLVYTPLWAEGMVAGKGWMALALVAFGTWHPGRIGLGAVLFGGLTLLQLHLQGQGAQIAPQLLGALPYLATVLVLVLISSRHTFLTRHKPASLGQPFTPA